MARAHQRSMSIMRCLSRLPPTRTATSAFRSSCVAVGSVPTPSRSSSTMRASYRPTVRLRSTQIMQSMASTPSRST